MTSPLLELDFPAGREAPGLARRALERHLADRVSEADRRTLVLLVSELVTNAIRHSGGAEAPVRLVVDASGRCVRVEVHDGGPGFERKDPPSPHPSGLGGFGLLLVERMADRWGVRGGSQVWFELDKSAA